MTPGDEGGRVDREPLSGCQRLVDAEVCESRTNQVLERNRRLRARQQGLHKRGPLPAMTFILTPARSDLLFATIAHQFQTPKILEGRGPSTAEYFDPLLGKCPVA